MKDRVLFENGNQKEFLILVKDKLNSTSIRGILQFGIDIPYSTLKDYYSENLLIPKDLFDDLCRLAKIDSSTLKIRVIKGNWGQIIGGKRGSRSFVS